MTFSWFIFNRTHIDNSDDSLKCFLSCINIRILLLLLILLILPISRAVEGQPGPWSDNRIWPCLGVWGSPQKNMLPRPSDSRKTGETPFSGIIFWKMASKIHDKVMRKMVFMNKGHCFICVSEIKLSIWKFVIPKTIHYGFRVCKVMYNVLKING